MLTGAWIVRDEQRCLERSLRSVAPFVDELLVVDTGSTDGTVRIARDAGARVIEHEWRDSFADARNAALEAARGDWVSFADADETLVDGGSRLREFADRQTDRVGLVDIVSRFELDGQPVTSLTVIDRVLPRAVRYEGRVHERPVHDLPAERIGVVYDHDGYTPEVSRAKRGRNEALLVAELDDRPGDPYLLYQLGKEWQVDERYADAAGAYGTALASASVDAPWRHSLVVRALYVYKQAADFSAAITLFETEQGRYQDSPDFWFTAGDLFLDLAMADPAAAPELLGLIEASWLRALEIGDRADVPGSVAGRGSYLAAHNLAAFYELTGDGARADRYRSLAARR